MGMPQSDPVTELGLPPGFRFYPTDEELMVQYLCRKIAGHQFPLQLIGEIDLYKFDPWVLPSKALFGEKEWYFFSPRARKYPKGNRPNRIAGSGYWKATGTDKPINSQGMKLGIKKALVFYVGKAPKGVKTNWIMHEYRVETSLPIKSGSSKLDAWVLCRIYKKKSGAEKAGSDNTTVQTREESNASSSSSASTYFEEALESLPELNDQTFVLPRINSLKAFDNEKFRVQPSVNNDWSNNTNNIMQNIHTLSDYTPNAQIQRQGEDVYSQFIPQMSQQFGRGVEEEVESASGLAQPGSYVMDQTFIDSFDPFGFGFMGNAVTGPFEFGK